MVGLVVAVADDEVVIGEVEERVGRLEGFECCIWVTGRWFSVSIAIRYGLLMVRCLHTN